MAMRRTIGGLNRDIRHIKAERDGLSDLIRAERATLSPNALKAFRETRDEHNQTLANLRAQKKRFEGKYKKRR